MNRIPLNHIGFDLDMDGPDFNNIRFIDLFAGIGGFRIALERNGCRCVFSSEIDEKCQRQYEANFGEIPAGDITKISAKEIPDHDILAAGFPCQAFSIIGNGAGFDDTRGTLFFEIERILKEKRPYAFILENVKNLASHDKGRTLKVILQHLDKLGYNVHWKVLNGLDFGVPQKRERIIIVGFLEKVPFVFPEGIPNRTNLADILESEENVDRKHFASDTIRQNRLSKVPNPQYYPSIWHENKSGDIGVHPYSCALRTGASYNYLLVNGERRLTPREMLRLQGFPDSYKIVVSDMVIRRQAGNSVVVPKIEAVVKNMIVAMKTPRKKTLDDYWR